MFKNLFQDKEMDNGHKKLGSSHMVHYIFMHAQTTIGVKGRKQVTLLISSMTVGVSQQYCCFKGYANLHIAGTTVSKASSWLPRRHILMPD